MTSPAITFRTAGPPDSPRIAALHAASWRSAYRDSLPTAYLAGAIDAERAQHWQARMAAPDGDRRLVLLAEQARELIGFVCVLLDEEPAWGACLDNLHVRADLKRQGIGRQLFGHAARWVLSVAPGWPLHLWVLEANQPARRFYDRFQGQAVERTMLALPGGAAIPAQRYLWRDLERLLADLSAERQL